MKIPMLKILSLKSIQIQINEISTITNECYPQLIRPCVSICIGPDRLNVDPWPIMIIYPKLHFWLFQLLWENLWPFNLTSQYNDYNDATPYMQICDDRIRGLPKGNLSVLFKTTWTALEMVYGRRKFNNSWQLLS